MSQLTLLGFSHKNAPLETREALAVLPMPEIFSRLREAGCAESVTLSTCNRFELYIKGEKTLYAFIEGQPEYELVPTGKNKFDLKILKAYSVQFEENEKGDILSASFIQPNGTFKAPKKK